MRQVSIKIYQQKQPYSYLKFFAHFGSGEEDASVQQSDWTKLLSELDVLIAHLWIHGRAHHISVSDWQTMLLDQFILKLDEIQRWQVLSWTAANRLQSFEDFAAQRLWEATMRFA